MNLKLMTSDETNVAEILSMHFVRSGGGDDSVGEYCNCSCR
jgi:hypothetical protein